MVNYDNLRKVDFVENAGLKNASLTKKGIAVLAWIECGLAPDIEDGKDISKFEEFWDKYETMLYNYCYGDNNG